jgi:hypothetical protein
MRLFILLAILFFSWRVFSQSFDYYYVDEYIRAQGDPQFAQYMTEKQKEQNQMRLAIVEFKAQQAQDIQTQEQARSNFVLERDEELKKANPEKLEKEYEKEKAKEDAEWAASQKQFIDEQVQREVQAEKQAQIAIKNERMVASIFPAEDHHRVPKDKRKFHFKKTPHK